MDNWTCFNEKTKYDWVTLVLEANQKNAGPEKKQKHGQSLLDLTSKLGRRYGP